MEERDRKREQYGCNGQCYWSTGMCPCVDTCPETRSKEGLATIAACIMYILVMASVYGLVGYTILAFVIGLVKDVLEMLFG